MFDLRDSLCGVADDTPAPYPEGTPQLPEPSEPPKPTASVIRIAAHASVMMIDKYLNLFWDCDIYVISMGICLLFFLYEYFPD